MSYEPHGRHLIAGEWVAGAATFESRPAAGAPSVFARGSAALVAAAAEAAEAAVWSYGFAPRETRAAFLEAIAEEIEARGPALTETAGAETGLPAARLEGERGRTTGQLRLFAAHIRAGEYLDRRLDPALPARAPLPRPEIRLMQRPVGPVAIFGASNFPLAFSVAGGDTASALAAGCPVVVKAHEAHPATSEIVAGAIDAARARLGLDAGVFSMVHGGAHEVGAALVQHPAIKAVGFTGSLGGGRALFDLCAARPEPIPFFGELGAVNPMFFLPGAAATRGAALGAAWAGSLTMGVGQFCTNPGIAVIRADLAGPVLAGATEALAKVGAQVMLTEGIAAAYRAGRDRIAAAPGVRAALSSMCQAREGSPNLFVVSGADWRANADLGHEVFGPLALLITVESDAEMVEIAKSFAGQLTATLHLEAEDTALAGRLMPVLERMAGRVLANGFPTGVEVCDAMVHGGPYPASTNFGATSVGTMPIRRFLRPVCYQNLPEALLPEDLRGL